MKLQVIQDGSGRDTGVFIPMEDWDLIKSTYPDITRLSHELPQWQKDLIDERLEAIAIDPKRIKPIEGLFHELNKED
jgi:hypothetical protein